MWKISQEIERIWQIEILNYISNMQSANILRRYKDLLELIPKDKDSGLIYLKQNQIKINMNEINLQKIIILLEKLSDVLDPKESKRVIKTQQRNKKNWKTEELQVLIYITDRYCYFHQSNIHDLPNDTWESISQLIPFRSPTDCMFRMLSVRKCYISENPWSQQQNTIFQEIILQYGLQWEIVSRELFLRNPMKIYRSSKLCKQHYTCFFDPSIKKGPWSREEDYLLAKMYSQIGRRWSKISKRIQGRNQNAVKNRFFLLFEQRKGRGKQRKNRSSWEIHQKVLKFKKDYEKESKQDQESYISENQLNANQVQIQANVSKQITQNNFNHYTDNFTEFLNL